MPEHHPTDLAAEEGSPPLVAVVMPVFNEQASVRKVVMEWFQEIENWTEEFVFLAINDGSTDETLKILQRLRDQLAPAIRHAPCDLGIILSRLSTSDLPTRSVFLSFLRVL